MGRVVVSYTKATDDDDDDDDDIIHNNQIGVGRANKDDGVPLLLLLLDARGLERIGGVFSSCWVMIKMTQQIIYYGMKFDGRQLKDGHKDKDTHNNQPKTRGDNGGCKERWHYLREVKVQRW